MTGSGKTGLGIVMLEELISREIPSIVIDIKGDLSTLANLNSSDYFVEVYVPEASDEIPPETGQLLFKDDKPGTTVIYLAHYSLTERAQMIARILGDFNLWMRKQGGSSDLRGLIHIDEIHGLIPPTKKSQTKEALMNLLKIARGFGFGVSLATQNPGDLDYKALSNIGTWFIGKLTTKRDRNKVREGLEGTISDEEVLSLKRREFIQRSVYDDTSKFYTRDITVPLNGPLSLNDALDHVDRFDTRYHCPELEEYSRVAEDPARFRKYCENFIEDARSVRVDKLKTSIRKDYDKLMTKQKRLVDRLATEEARLKERDLTSAASIATTVMSLFTSKSIFSTTNVNRAGSVVKNRNKVETTKDKIERVRIDLQEIRNAIGDLTTRLNDELAQINSGVVEVLETRLWDDLRQL
jgi:division protein CdvB (Snf7/Vps24/ESCRT-III family)